jgi:hypothetical protein
VRTKRQHHSIAKTAVAAPSANKRANWTEIINDAIRTTPIFSFHLGEREPCPQIKS